MNRSGRIDEPDGERFQSPTAGPIRFDQIVLRLLVFVAANPENHYRLVVGTDSLPAFDGRAVLISAIVLHRVGHGGIYFWRRQRSERLHTLRDRMIAEALASLELATRLREDARVQELLTGTMEIHVDVGENGPTRQMIAEIVGMVVAHGFTVRTKPDAYAASKVADRHTVAAYALAD